ncbi:MAG: hypothetical protein OFPI_10410 [Osedax symbiont Rs2]|nr:MAG: hypothetical protein OFPI_10410 [Osedax symbiont Rs2]
MCLFLPDSGTNRSSGSLLKSINHLESKLATFIMLAIANLTHMAFYLPQL